MPQKKRRIATISRAARRNRRTQQAITESIARIDDQCGLAATHPVSQHLGAARLRTAADDTGIQLVWEAISRLDDQLHEIRATITGLRAREHSETAAEVSETAAEVSVDV